MNRSRTRPGCITAYAINLWILAAIALIAVVMWIEEALLARGVMNVLAVLSLIIFLLPTVPSLLIGIVAGIGLWKMRRWGLILALVQLSFLILSALAVGSFLFRSLTISDTLLIIPLLLFFLAIGILIYWFIRNRHLFDGR